MGKFIEPRRFTSNPLDVNPFVQEVYYHVAAFKDIVNSLKCNITKFYKDNPESTRVMLCGKPLEQYLSDFCDIAVAKLDDAIDELYEKEAMMLLKEYALAEDDQLSDSALNLKRRLQNIASWSLRQEGPNPVQEEINAWKDIVDSNDTFDKQQVLGILNRIEKRLEESLYTDGKHEVLSILQTARNYMTRRLGELIEERQNGDDEVRAAQKIRIEGGTAWVEGCEESIIRGRIDAAIESIKEEDTDKVQKDKAEHQDT